MRKIGYFFKKGRVERVSGKHKFPADFFYGYGWLKKNSLNAEIIDAYALGVTTPMSILLTLVTHMLLKTLGVHFAVIYRLFNKSVLKKINDKDILIVTTTSLGTSLAFLKMLGFFKGEILFIVMGIGDLLSNPIRRIILNRILLNTTLITISKGEFKKIKESLNRNINIKYMPFGVDKKFWFPKNGSKKNYILSIGNDSNRDYDLLIKIWKPEFPELILVTMHKIKTNLKNIKIIKGDWNESILSDSEIRELIQGSRFIIIPLRKTTQPSGQSVCLQAMACGKAVIIAETDGLWDMERLNHKENCLLYKPEDLNSLKELVLYAINNTNDLENIGRQARKLIEKDFNSDVTGQSIFNMVEEI